MQDRLVFMRCRVEQALLLILLRREEVFLSRGAAFLGTAGGQQDTGNRDDAGEQQKSPREDAEHRLILISRTSMQRSGRLCASICEAKLGLNTSWRVLTVVGIAEVTSVADVCIQAGILPRPVERVEKL